MRQTLVSAGLLSHEQLAAAYGTALEEQAEQDPLVDLKTRQLAVATIGTVFASQVKQPRPRPQLVINNDVADDGASPEPEQNG